MDKQTHDEAMRSLRFWLRRLMTQLLEAHERCADELRKELK